MCVLPQRLQCRQSKFRQMPKMRAGKICCCWRKQCLWLMYQSFLDQKPRRPEQLRPLFERRNLCWWSLCIVQRRKIQPLGRRILFWLCKCWGGEGVFYYCIGAASVLHQCCIVAASVLHRYCSSAGSVLYFYDFLFWPIVLFSIRNRVPGILVYCIAPMSWWCRVSRR